jgi:hypothetical protein
MIYRGTDGVVVLVILCLSLFWVAVTVRVECTSANLVTLGCGVSTLRIGASTLEMCVACHAAWVVLSLMHIVLTFATSFFAIAI